jgi:flagellar hook-basal body complex protein FliE
MNIPGIKPFSSVPSIGETSKTQKPSSAAEGVAKSFDQVMSSLNSSQSNVDGLMSQLSQGENVDIHQIMLATEENDLNFRVTMGIRDRLVDAYREVMRMSI